MFIFVAMKKRKEKFADLLLDIVRYIITAGLLAVWFGDFQQWEWYSYVILIVVVIVTIIGALYLYSEDKEKNK